MNEPVKLSPKDRRLAAVNDLLRKYIVQEGPEIGNLAPNPCPATMMHDIAALHPLGRSAKWHDAVDAWVYAVDEYRETNLKWAFVQYAIYMSWAA